jgi:hypothetical protein
LQYILALWRSIYQLGIHGVERAQYWRLFFLTLFRRKRLFPLALTLAIMGFHFRQVVELHSANQHLGLSHNLLKRSYINDRQNKQKKEEKTTLQRATHTRTAAEARSGQDQPRSQVANLFLTHTV